MERAGKKRQRRSQTDYSLAFKLQVVEDVEKDKLTYKEAQIKYGIQGKSTVLVWLRKHGNLDWTTPKPNTMDSNEKTPEQRITELEAALRESQLKAKLLETMIDIAEKQYGMVIRKKSSPRQQRNSSKQGD